MHDTTRNVVTLDYASSPGLAELFLNKQVGEKCKITLELMITEKDDQSVSGVLKTIEGYAKQEEGVKDEDHEMEVDPQSPVMVIMGPKSKK